MDCFILRDSPFSYFNVGFLQMYEDWEFVLHFGHQFEDNFGIVSFTDAKKWKDKFEEAKMIVETQCELYAKECK